MKATSGRILLSAVLLGAFVTGAEASSITVGGCGVSFGLSFTTANYCRENTIQTLHGGDGADFLLTASGDSFGNLSGINPFGSAMAFSSGDFGVVHAYALADRSGIAIPDPPFGAQFGIESSVAWYANDIAVASSTLPAAPITTATLTIDIEALALGNGKLSQGTLLLQHGSQFLDTPLHVGVNAFSIPNVSAGDQILFGQFLAFAAGVSRGCCASGGVIVDSPLISFIDARNTVTVTLTFDNPTYSSTSVSGHEYGPGTSATPVPEPSTLLLVVLGGGLEFRRRRARRLFFAASKPSRAARPLAQSLTPNL
jgi:hypothetical protein